MEVIFAPEDKKVNGPVIFLAGPIQGAEDWHKRAIEILKEKKKEINIASPRGDYTNIKFDYLPQVNWETKYLNLAAKEGVIIFWLAKEKTHDPERSYAQTSRFELAEWVTKFQSDKNINIVIGIEPGFSGEKYIRKRVGEDSPEIEILSTLKETCEKAVSKIK